MNIVLGSNNKHKAQEIQSIIDNIAPDIIKICLPNQVSSEFFDVEETGDTLEQNALIKSTAFFKFTQIPTISDDTGLEIDFLNGEPGVKSARFSGVHGNDENNRKKVLDLLSNQPFENRKAKFRTVISYTDIDGSWYAEGICNGIISFVEKGSNGFGYDSIFIPNGYNCCFAEMDSELKNSISHRKKAIENFIRLFLSINRLKVC